MNEKFDGRTDTGGTIPRVKFRLETGLDVLNEWAETANQNQRNAVYKALFAMVDGSLFRDYRIVDDFQRPSELFVIVRDDLVLKIRVNCFDSFGVVHIGPCGNDAHIHTGECRHDHDRAEM